MSTQIRSSNFARRALDLAALSAMICASVGASAQLAASSAGTQPVALTSQAQTSPTLDLQLPADASSSSSSSTFSSSSADNEVAVNAEHFNFVNAMQYGGRRYGKPRYRGGNTNPDGSSKYVFFAGAGFTQPLGDTYHLLTPDYGFQFGGGRQFSNKFAVPIQFDYDNFGFTRQNISNEAYIYTGDPNAADNGIDANSHIWSFTVDPTYTFYQSDTMGAYVVGAVGFYHKVANLTAPQTAESEDEFGDIEEYEIQGNFADYTSNAVGFNGGFGLTYKLSHFSNERLYGEVRYVFINNSQRYGYTVANLNTTTYDGYNAYPANSNKTTYIPVKFGIRF